MLALLLLSVAIAEPLRVAAWNLETVGEPGSAEYEAALDVLARVGADLVGICEVNGDADRARFAAFAEDAGYLAEVTAPPGPFGTMGCAFLSDLPILSSAAPSAALLSGDPDANDLTRYPLQVVVDLTGQGDELVAVVNHWKSGTADADEFRRAVESWRIAGLLDDGAPYVVMGDVNEEIDSVPRSPAVFTQLPADLPSTWTPGADIEDLLAGDGLANDPFAPFLGGAVAVEARQADGSDATRPESGRRIDYLFASDDVDPLEAWVYDSEDEALAVEMGLLGEPLATGTSLAASDHLLVFADLDVPVADRCTIDLQSADWYALTRVLRVAARCDEDTTLEVYVDGQWAGTMKHKGLASNLHVFKARWASLPDHVEVVGPCGEAGPMGVRTLR